MSSATAPPPPPATNHEPSEKEKALRAENESLKAELKELEETFTSLQSDLDKSSRMRERLDGLAKELENRTKEIKAENRARMLEAENQGKELATEVSTNMGIMQNLNTSLSSVATESQKAKEENEDLATQVGALKIRYDDREKVLQEELNEAHNGHIAAQTELARLKLRNAEEKERLFSEMQKVANGLVQSKTEMKEAKETELNLRVLLKKYDEKFGGLQSALQETNSAYDTFRDEMEKMSTKTKDLEKEALLWKDRWEKNNEVLLEKTKEQETIHNDLKQAHDKLLRMTSLCRALQTEISSLEKKTFRTIRLFSQPEVFRIKSSEEIYLQVNNINMEVKSTSLTSLYEKNPKKKSNSLPNLHTSSTEGCSSCSPCSKPLTPSSASVKVIPALLQKTWNKIKSMNKKRSISSSAPTTPNSFQKFDFEQEPEEPDPVQENYVKLQKRLSEELHQGQIQLKNSSSSSSNNNKSKYCVSEEFRKKLQQWEMWKTSHDEPEPNTPDTSSSLESINQASGSNTSSADFYQKSRRRSSDAVSTPLSARSPSLSAFTSDDEDNAGLLKTVQEEDPEEKLETPSNPVVRANQIVVVEEEDAEQCFLGGVFVPTKRTIFKPIESDSAAELTDLRSPNLVRSASATAAHTNYPATVTSFSDSGRVETPSPGTSPSSPTKLRAEDIWNKNIDASPPPVRDAPKVVGFIPKLPPLPFSPSASSPLRTSTPVGSYPGFSSCYIQKPVFQHDGLKNFPRMGKAPVWVSPLVARRKMNSMAVSSSFRDVSEFNKGSSRTTTEFTIDRFLESSNLASLSSSPSTSKYTIGGGIPPQDSVRLISLSRSSSFGMGKLPEPVEPPVMEPAKVCKSKSASSILKSSLNIFSKVRRSETLMNSNNNEPAQHVKTTRARWFLNKF
ncbi:unnamed protein product [Allacma fusca]|uniref:Uncharacterized protein n=1 Tax=Allacma fusca TaxID=39272 RepID=A0A8J2K645_9HEXA|nr:unnamed protein product [Allacma fusca]